MGTWLSTCSSGTAEVAARFLSPCSTDAYLALRARWRCGKYLARYLFTDGSVPRYSVLSGARLLSGNEKVSASVPVPKQMARYRACCHCRKMTNAAGFEVLAEALTGSTV